MDRPGPTAHKKPSSGHQLRAKSATSSARCLAWQLRSSIVSDRQKVFNEREVWAVVSTIRIDTKTRKIVIFVSFVRK